MKWLVSIVIVALTCFGLSACAGPAASESQVKKWLKDRLTVSFKYLSKHKEESPNRLYGSIVTYYFQDASGLQFYVRSYVSGGIFASRQLYTNYAGAWLDSHMSQVDSLLAPYHRVNIEDTNDRNELQIGLPSGTDIDDLANRIAALANNLVLPLKNRSDLAPKIWIVPASVAAWTTANEYKYIVAAAMRGENDALLDSTAIASSVTATYDKLMRTGYLDRTADPTYAALIPPDPAQLVCIVHDDSDCKYLSAGGGHVPFVQVVMLVRLKSDGSAYYLPSDSFNLSESRSTYTDREYVWTFADSVTALGGTYTSTGDQATWTVCRHTWQAEQTDGMAVSPAPSSSSTPAVISRTVERDGVAVRLSATAAAGGDLTVDDLKALLGVKFTISPLQNYTEVTCLD